MGTNSCEVHVDLDKVGQSYYQPLVQAGHEPKSYLMGNSFGSEEMKTPAYDNSFSRVNEMYESAGSSRNESMLKSRSPSYSVDFSDTGEVGLKMRKDSREMSSSQHLENSNSPSYVESRASRPMESAFDESD